MYPWQVRKSSSSVWDFSEESFMKQKTVTNISTTSKGFKSTVRCMFSTHNAKQPLSEERLKQYMEIFFKNGTTLASFCLFSFFPTKFLQ